MDQLLLYPSADGWDVDQFYMRLSIEQYLKLLLYYFMLLEITGKVLLDRTLCTVLLFIVYTVTNNVQRVYDYCLLIYCIVTVTLSS